MELERRYFELQEIRVEGGDDKPLIIRGHAAVFNSLSVPLWGFREKLAPGAFQNSLNKNPDVRALWNHNPDTVLGRTRSKTLTLKEDDKGLFMEINPPTWAAGYVETIQRGDVSQMSFGFRTIKDQWDFTDPKNIVRTLIEVDINDGDVSPVSYPAYPKTDVAVRSMLREAGISDDELAAAVIRAKSGQDLTARDRQLIQGSADSVRQWLTEDVLQRARVTVGPGESLRQGLQAAAREIELLALRIG